MVVVFREDYEVMFLVGVGRLILRGNEGELIFIIEIVV